MCGYIYFKSHAGRGWGERSVEVLTVEACLLEFGSPIFAGYGDASVIPEPGRWAHQELLGAHCPAA